MCLSVNFYFLIFFSSIRFIISSFESQRTNEADEKNIIILWLVCSRCLNSVCHSVVVCRFYFCREYIVTKSLTLTVRRVCLVILLVFFYTYFFLFLFLILCVIFFRNTRFQLCVRNDINETNDKTVMLVEIELKSTKQKSIHNHIQQQQQ